MYIKKIILPIILSVFMVACTPFIDNRGFNHETLDLTKITIGVDTKETVLEKFGSPSSKSLFPVTPNTNESKWFYITKRVSTTAFFKPETLNQQTIALCFNDKDILTDILKIDGETVVSMNPDKTVGTGYESNVMRDIFGNFGRYSVKSPQPRS